MTEKREETHLERLERFTVDLQKAAAALRGEEGEGALRLARGVPYRVESGQDPPFDIIVDPPGYVGCVRIGNVTWNTELLYKLSDTTWTTSEDEAIKVETSEAGHRFLRFVRSKAWKYA